MPADKRHAPIPHMITSSARSHSNVVWYMDNVLLHRVSKELEAHPTTCIIGLDLETCSLDEKAGSLKQQWTPQWRPTAHS